LLETDGKKTIFYGMRFAFVILVIRLTILGRDVKIRKNSGVSLIELIIVMALIGIVAAIATPNFTRYRDNTNLREAARDVSSDIQLYKQRAVAENVRYRITFDSGANNYVVQRETPLNAGNFAANTLFTKQIGSGTAIETSVAANFGGNLYVTLLPRGTIEEAGGSLTIRHITRLSTATINVNIMGRTNVDYTLK